MDVTLECKIVVTTKGEKSKKSEVLIKIENQTTLAYLLAESHLPVAESRFQKTWESAVAEPVQIQFAEAVRELMESLKEKEVEAEMAMQLPEPNASMFLEEKTTTEKNEQQDSSSNPG
tara:strand:- start:8 stop:361 length:354 start_codon:yes stop_codon:yes gene_type:complete